MPSWEAEGIVDRLKSLWSGGYSAGRIAQLLNDEFPGGGNVLTRNAVIGKVNRLFLQRKGPKKPTETIPRVRRVKPVPKVQLRPRPEPLPKVEVEPNLSLSDRINLAFCAVDDSKGVLIRDLENDMCKWPIGPFMAVSEKFCGDIAAIGSVYCPCHHAMSIAPATTKKVSTWRASR